MSPVGPGSQVSFIIQKPGQIGIGGLGTEVFFRSPEILEAAFFLRREGASFLREVSMSFLQSEIKDFVTKNYFRIIDHAFSNDDRTYDKFVTSRQLQNMANALALSRLFTPPASLHLFPLVTVEIREPLKGSVASLWSVDQLADEFASESIYSGLDPTFFPPLPDKRPLQHRPLSWLGVRSPAKEAARKARNAVLGAVQLKLSHRYRYLWTGREVFGGWCEINDGRVTYSISDKLTPSLSDDVILAEQEKAWFRELDRLLASSQSADIRARKGLEYYYRSWFLTESDRFPVLCMALDALYGDVAAATQSLINGIQDTLLAPADETRLRLMIKLRASVIHGGAPDVYESSKYEKYYRDYGVNPIKDMEVLVAECFRRKVFNGSIEANLDPYADVIKAEQEAGRFPLNLHDDLIVAGGS